MIVLIEKVITVEEISSFQLLFIGDKAVTFPNKISDKYDDKPKRKGSKVCAGIYIHIIYYAINGFFILTP